VADVLSEFADILEASSDFTKSLNELIRKTIKEHNRIISNGNNYSEDWPVEAEKRGLLNLKTTPEALPYFISEKNIKLFTKHNVFSETEIHSRYEILLENYSKTINIEALTMIEMSRKEILPAVTSYIKELSETASLAKSVATDVDCSYETEMVKKLSSLTGIMFKKVNALDETLLKVKELSGALDIARYYSKGVFIAMQELRAVADEIETLVGEKHWPFPTYGELLFNV
jgi:glutamine synthetase